MNLEKLYKLQAELDNHILENEKKRTGKEIDKSLLLDQTILALLVEVGELANATRCFKHWSTKGSESKERILDELADVWHFYLSIGNQMILKADKPLVLKGYTLIELFIKTYEKASRLTEVDSSSLFVRHVYEHLGMLIYNIGKTLGFTGEEVEQAYMKKHEENYRRQREGY